MFATIKRIINWCEEFKGKLYTGFIFSFLSYWFAAAPTAIAALMLCKLINAKKNGLPLENKLIGISALLILISIFLRFLFDYLRAKYQETISYELIARDRLAIGDALKRVSLGYFQENSTGQILSSLTTGLTTLENMGIRMIDTFIGGYLNFLAILLFLLFLSPITAAISLVTALFSFLALLLVSSHSKKTTSVEAQANKDLTTATLEFARGLSVIKSFNQEGSKDLGINGAILSSEETHLNVEWGFMPGHSLHLLALKCGTVALGVAACLSGLAGELTLETVLMLVLFSFTIFAPLEPISDSAHVLGVIENAMDQIDALKASNFIDKDGKEIKLDNFDIDFKHVRFGYEGHRTVIDNVSFHIPEKTSTAIIGPSGSGKTTLVNLLARFYDVNEGSISLGGHNVKEFTCDSLLSNISMVFQNVYLFQDTIRNNICFGRTGTTEEEMIDAAKKACCHDFIMSLPNGYDTVIGEGGETLSGGEKQRISIARAILKDSPVIILDEATASIDPENEHLIQNALSQLIKGKTVITIAHRLATIEQADQILVVENGKIVQSGKHKDLVQQDGIYKRFTEARSRAEGWSIN